jgi:hypothetical protein
MAVQKSIPLYWRGARPTAIFAKRHRRPARIAERFPHAPVAPKPTHLAACTGLRCGCEAAAYPREFLRILLVGSETPQEFREALRLTFRGHQVFVVNPRETDAARNFRAASGHFLAARIEHLPRPCGGFDLILENYPYPSGRHYVPPLPFARARLSRLAHGGRWMVYTESRRYASLLEAAVAYHPRLAQRFSVRRARVPLDAAPPSSYPQLDTRFLLVFKRRG